MITVKFFTTLRILLRLSEFQFAATPGTVFDLLSLCERRTPKPFLHKLIDAQNSIIPGTIILVNGHNILHLNGLDTELNDGDEVALFPPGGGG